MKNIKMIVTDLDGTYLRTDKTISEYSRKIITECRNKGLLFIIATARPIPVSYTHLDVYKRQLRAPFPHRACRPLRAAFPSGAGRPLRPGFPL